VGAAAGLRLDAYREAHVERCLARARDLAGVEGDAALAAALGRDPQLRTRLRRWVAVSHSGLFRDPEQFSVLEQVLLPGLLHRRRGAPRVWSAGCAAGQELWSVAAILQRLGALDGAVLVGSDLLQENVEAAGRADVPLPPGATPAVRFERRDLTREPALPGEWDLVLCRNLGIYLAPGAKERLHRILAGALAPGGVLLLGRTERLASPAALGLRALVDRAYERVEPAG